MGHGELRSNQATASEGPTRSGIQSEEGLARVGPAEPRKSTDSTDESSVDCGSIFKKEEEDETPRTFDEKSVSSESEEEHEAEDPLPNWMPRTIEFDPNAENIVEREEREMKEQRKKRSSRKNKQPKLKKSTMSEMLSNESQHSNTSSLAAPRVPQRTNSNDKPTSPSPSPNPPPSSNHTQNEPSHESPPSMKSHQEQQQPPKRSVARSTGSLGAGSLTGMIMQMSATSLHFDADSQAHSAKSSSGRNSLSARGSLSARTSLGLLSRSDHQIIMSPDQPRGRKTLQKNRRTDGDASDESSWDSQESFGGDDDDDEEENVDQQELSAEEETLIRAFAAKTGALEITPGSAHSAGSLRQRLSLGSRKSLSGRKLNSSSSTSGIHQKNAKRPSLRRSANDGIIRRHSTKSLDPLSVSDHSRLLRSPRKETASRDPLSVSDHSRLARVSPRKVASKPSVDAEIAQNDESALLRSSMSSNKSHRSSCSGKSRTSLRRSKARSSLKSHKDGKSPRPRLLKSKRDRMPTEPTITNLPESSTSAPLSNDVGNKSSEDNESIHMKSGLPICISLESLSSNDNEAAGDDEVDRSTNREKQTCAVAVQ